MKTRPRRALDFVLGFVAGGAIVGIPVAEIFDVPWWVGVIVVLAAGLAGGIWGDDFLEWVGDSRWWAAVRGIFWRV